MSYRNDNISKYTWASILEILYKFANNSLSNQKQPEDKYLSRENVKIVEKIGTSLKICNGVHVYFVTNYLQRFFTDLTLKCLKNSIFLITLIIQKQSF